ncbi:cytochrome c peroxidase [Desulfovibrio piger]|mgnify:FL=1|uniref:cytochrome c peroxidase n=1 Tax=Desulfovibrio piger TaxID=901 RepID=UPI0026F0C012|nr:cytochrome c peroxidase [Desulfovibrio piger]
MKEKLLASAALVLLACAPATAQGLDDVQHKFASVSGIVQDKCMACHSRGYDLPFYAKVPGIRGIIEKDYRDGIRALDLNQELVQRKDRPVGETVLAKMEWVILNDTMPPAKFAVVHWGSRLSDQDKKDILTWVAESRKAHYATDAAPEHANEPIQPIPRRLPVDEAKVALGKALFNDARLSADSTVACATCHAMDKAGTDNGRFSEGIRKQLGDVNAPTTFNAVFNFVQFWDGRAADLQEQAGGPPLNPIEMGSRDWDEIVARLAADAALTAKFRAVYPDGWSGRNITDAIAEYEKTLISPDSRFDRWLRGDKSALTAAEAEGYERFKAYRCASCHVGKSMGGQSYEYLDLKKDYFADRGGKPLGSDKGRFNASGREEDMHRFKVPNLRNVELTHPYLHDGTVTTLDEAVRIMGVYCSGLDVPQKDRALIVGFLRTLTGRHEGHPVQGEAVAR